MGQEKSKLNYQIKNVKNEQKQRKTLSHSFLGSNRLRRNGK